MKSTNVLDKVDERVLFTFLRKLREKKKMVDNLINDQQEDGLNELVPFNQGISHSLDCIIQALDEALQ